MCICCLFYSQQFVNDHVRFYLLLCKSNIFCRDAIKNSQEQEETVNNKINRLQLLD